MSLEVLVPDMKRQLVGYRSQQLTLCFLNMNLKLFELLNSLWNIEMYELKKNCMFCIKVGMIYKLF